MVLFLVPGMGLGLRKEKVMVRLIGPSLDPISAPLRLEYVRAFGHDRITDGRYSIDAGGLGVSLTDVREEVLEWDYFITSYQRETLEAVRRSA